MTAKALAGWSSSMEARVYVAQKNVIGEVAGGQTLYTLVRTMVLFLGNHWKVVSREVA